MGLEVIPGILARGGYIMGGGKKEGRVGEARERETGGFNGWRSSEQAREEVYGMVWYGATSKRDDVWR